MASIRLSYVLCKPTGEPVGELIQAAQRTFSKHLNTPTTATIQVRLEDAAAVWMLPGQARLKVYRAATAAELAANPAATRRLVAYLQLPETGTSEDAGSGFITATFQDPRWLLTNRFLPAAQAFTATEQSTIAWQLVAAQNARAGGDTFLLQGNDPTGLLRDRNYEAGNNVAQLLDELSQVISGPDYSVDPVDGFAASGATQMGVFNVWATQGIDRPNAIFTYIAPATATTGGQASNVEGIRRSFMRVVTSATAVGTAADGSAITQTYSYAGSSAFGLREDYSTYQDVNTAATLLEKATGTVNDLLAPREIIEIVNPTPDAPLPLVDYDLGDTIRVNCIRGPRMTFTNRVARVYGFEFEVDQEGELSSQTIVTTP